MKSQYYTVDLPLYLAAREHFLSQGMDRGTSIELAEQVVRDAQGGGSIVDTAEAMQGGAYRKLFTNFLTYMITTYNLQAENFQRTRKGEQGILDFALNSFVLLTMPAVLTAMLSAFSSGDDEDWAERLIREQIAFLLGMNTWTAQMSGAAMGFDYEGPQGTAIIGKAGGLVQQGSQGEIDEALVRASIWVFGLATGLPAAQANRMIFGAKQAVEEDDDALTATKKVLFGKEYP